MTCSRLDMITLRERLAKAIVERDNALVRAVNRAAERDIARGVLQALVLLRGCCVCGGLATQSESGDWTIHHVGDCSIERALTMALEDDK